MALKPIEILINAKDNASGVFNSLKATVVTVGGAIAAYFGINAFANIVKGAADLEQGMSRVQAATGATAEEMAALRKAAEDAGANTKYTATEAAGALENLAKAGLSSSEAIAALPAVLNLAAAGDIELGTSAEFVTKAVQGMGLSFDDAGRVADVLAKGANATNTSVTGLAQALSYAAPVAQSLGLSLEGTVAIIGKFADAGIDASRAGTALNSILSQFSNPASKFREELASAGITTNNFETALDQLALAGPRGATAILAVGQEAGPALRALLNQGTGALRDLKARLEDAKGSAAETAKVMQANLEGAFKNLASAWETVTNALGKPVLPILTEAVRDLADMFRRAVADGTVQKFGDSIATAFQNGVKFVRDFVSQIDFTAVLARMQQFADDVNATLTKVGEYATNAGNVVKTAWGTMTAGSNTVLVVIYGLGEAFAKVAQGIMTGIQMLREGLSKVTFGGLSDAFKEAARDAEVSAGAFGAVADAMSQKGAAALAAVADGAQLARDGFAGLTGAAAAAAPQIASTSSGLGEVAKKLEATAEANAKARAATEAKAKADAESSAAIQKLKEDYHAFLEAGNVQRATEEFLKLKKAQQEVANASKGTANSTEEESKRIQQAYKELGITTTETLKTWAANAKANYDVIRASGKESAEDVANAFKVAADKAIAANNGIAPSWVQVEAAARGYRVSVDAAGKSTLELASTTGSAAGNMTTNINRVAGAWGGVVKELQNVDAWTRRNEERSKQVSKNSIGGATYDKEGFATNASGQRVAMEIQNRNSVYQQAKSAGLSASKADEIAASFIGGRGEYIGYDRNTPWGVALQKAIGDAVRQQDLDAERGGPYNQPTTTPSPSTSDMRVVNIYIDSGPAISVPTTSQGERNLQVLSERFVDMLAAAKGVS